MMIQNDATFNEQQFYVVDAKTGKPTKVGRKVTAEGKIVRYAKKSGEEIK